MLKYSIELRRYMLCGGVAACPVHTPDLDMLPHHRITYTYNDVILPSILT